MSDIRYDNIEICNLTSKDMTGVHCQKEQFITFTEN